MLPTPQEFALHERENDKNRWRMERDLSYKPEQALEIEIGILKLIVGYKIRFLESQLEDQRIQKVYALEYGPGYEKWVSDAQAIIERLEQKLREVADGKVEEVQDKLKRSIVSELGKCSVKETRALQDSIEYDSETWIKKIVEHKKDAEVTADDSGKDKEK